MLNTLCLLSKFRQPRMSEMRHNVLKWQSSLHAFCKYLIHEVVKEKNRNHFIGLNFKDLAQPQADKILKEEHKFFLGLLYVFTHTKILHKQQTCSEINHEIRKRPPKKHRPLFNKHLSFEISSIPKDFHLPWITAKRPSGMHGLFLQFFASMHQNILEAGSLTVISGF